MGRQWEVTRKSLVQIPRLGGEMSEVHLLIEDQWLEQESPPSLWSDVIVEVKCLSESDTDIVGFSRFHAGSPSLCYDILYWFSINLLSRPLPYYTAKYRGNYVFTSMSNKVTVKLIGARLQTFLFWVNGVRTYVGEYYPVELILFQQALIPQHMSGDFREFSLSTILQISCGLIIQAQSSTSPREKGLCDPRLWIGTSRPVAKRIHNYGVYQF